MKIAESWLREWVNPEFDSEELAHQLTMAGHEVESVEEIGGTLDGVVVAEVLEAKKHPNADRLRVCLVADGHNEPVEVVCGAANAVAGMRAVLAKPGSTLPNGLKLRKSKIRGVDSNGMLCSSAELGLGDEADGIISLPLDAPLGESLAAYLHLPDRSIDINLTPNRGDCFSILGVARDLAALTSSNLLQGAVTPVAAVLADSHPVLIEAPETCPNFAGRVIRGINNHARSPLWMTERLRRSGLRPISPVVDVTNYVMLELGQPLHAYDLKCLQGAIRPRPANAGENLTLLDGREVTVNADTLVISDDSGAIGLAGIMGGLSTAVSDATADVFFEAAFWPQDFIAGRARSYGLHTDASLRFERGVDPQGQARAIERATELLVAICGGRAGPTVVQTAKEYLPGRKAIHLRRARLQSLLGIAIGDDEISDTLQRLGMKLQPVTDGWNVVAPDFRFDIAIEVDLIEEIARVYGYDRIPAATPEMGTPLATDSEDKISVEQVVATLIARDYQEVITYSFVDATADRTFTGLDSALCLTNPISSEMAVMRASLIPGLLSTCAANLARQQDRVRIFEIGKSFHGTPENHHEVLRIAAASCGSALPEQWGAKTQAVDFFDLKADVEAVLALAGARSIISFTPAEHAILQPGQCANILREGQTIGIVGKLHPRHAKFFGLKRAAFVFELDAAQALASLPPVAVSVSKYPSIRRDIAVLVNEKIAAEDLLGTVAGAAPDLISSVRIFDIYQGPGIEAGLKSVALGLILQETSRTLTDDDADLAMAAAVRELQEKYGAELRD